MKFVIPAKAGIQRMSAKGRISPSAEIPDKNIRE